MEIDVGGHAVTITNPGKVFFPEARYTKLDVVNYYLAVGEGALVGIRDRPAVLKRFVNGAAEEPFFQKRAPSVPEYMTTAHVTFPLKAVHAERKAESGKGLRKRRGIQGAEFERRVALHELRAAREVEAVPE